MLDLVTWDCVIMVVLRTETAEERKKQRNLRRPNGLIVGEVVIGSATLENL
jgi:hypothetical protein